MSRKTKEKWEKFYLSLTARFNLFTANTLASSILHCTFSFDYGTVIAGK
jgi:hypothetical protein